MDVAFCVPAGQTYLARDFAKLPSKEIARLRHQLTCVDCANPAFFRAGSRNGRAACFVGHPHVEGCPSATIGDGAQGVGGGVDAAPRHNPDDHVIVDLRGAIEGDPDAPGSAPAKGQRKRRRAFEGGDGARRSYSYRRLRKLLRTLIQSPSFATSTTVMELQGELTLPAHQFFKPLKDARRADDDALHAYWGRLRDAVVSSGTVWLNPKGSGPVIPVDATERAALLTLARVKRLVDLNDAHVLVLGKRFTSQNQRGVIAYSADLSRLAIIPDKEAKTFGVD